MNREQKAAAIDEIATNIREAQAVFAVDYRGLSVPQVSDLRARLRDADARFETTPPPKTAGGETTGTVPAVSRKSRAGGS